MELLVALWLSRRLVPGRATTTICINKTEDYHQKWVLKTIRQTFTCVGNRPSSLDDILPSVDDVELWPKRLTGHLWGNDAKFSLDGIRDTRVSTVTRQTFAHSPKLSLIENISNSR
ncbi:hypothetical protein F5884DRAFT_808780 [Xylogone sp. PMI_703]|nr:hypothetical protein F5884DRAFT_808780 [Xylogone sp. PMI_703]